MSAHQSAQLHPGFEGWWVVHVQYLCRHCQADIDFLVCQAAGILAACTEWRALPSGASKPHISLQILGPSCYHESFVWNSSVCWLIMPLTYHKHIKCAGYSYMSTLAVGLINDLSPFVILCSCEWLGRKNESAWHQDVWIAGSTAFLLHITQNSDVRARPLKDWAIGQQDGGKVRLCRSP